MVIKWGQNIWENLMFGVIIKSGRPIVIFFNYWICIVYQNIILDNYHCINTCWSDFKPGNIKNGEFTPSIMWPFPSLNSRGGFFRLVIFQVVFKFWDFLIDSPIPHYPFNPHPIHLLENALGKGRELLKSAVQKMLIFKKN